MAFQEALSKSNNSGKEKKNRLTDKEYGESTRDEELKIPASQ